MPQVDLESEDYMPVTAGAHSADADEDLSATLHHIGKDELSPARLKLANSPPTRAFLELGIELLKTDLVEHTGPDFEQGLRSRLFESLSQPHPCSCPGA